MSASKDDTTQRVRIWDIPVRLIHWLLVALVGFSWWSGENHQMQWHRWSGYAIVGLVVFRIFWGLFGSGAARFSSFVRGPRAVINYSKTLLTPHHHISPGHNPMGGWSVIALIVVLLVQTVTGLFATDVDGLESGPMSYLVSFDTGRLMSDIHELAFTALQVLVALHLLAVLFYLFVKRENLIAAMVGGYKRLPSGHTPPTFAPPWMVVIGLVIAGAVVWAIMTGLGFLNLPAAG